MLTTDVNETTAVVKLDGGDERSQTAAVADNLVKFFARVDEVLKTKFGGNESEWCRQAGVTRTYLGAARSKHETGEQRTVKLEAVRKLADAADVSVDWLMGDVDARDRDHAIAQHVYIELEMPQPLRDALDQFEWPDGTTTKQIATISDALRKDAFAHRDSYIPPSHWKMRIREELQASKGKRVAGVAVADDGDESPEVRGDRRKPKRL